MSAEDGRAPGAEEDTFADVRDSDVVVELLSAREPLDGTDDELLRLLSGWAAVVDAEADAATRPGRGRPVPADLSALATGGVRPVRPVRPARAERAGRTPWWVLSAGAAAAIAVMAVGLGAQDAAQVRPSTVAESQQSIASTLVAARLAAEQGDVVGARTLLDRARALVAELPADERAQFDAALGATEQGVAAAEDAVRRGEPVPVWPDLPGLPDVPAGLRPDVPPGPGGLPGQPTAPAEDGQDPGGQGGQGGQGQDGQGGEGQGTGQGGGTTPTARPADPTPPRATPSRPATVTTTPAPAPTTTAPPATPTAPAPTPRRTTGSTPTLPPPAQGPGGNGGGGNGGAGNGGGGNGGGGNGGGGNGGGNVGGENGGGPPADPPGNGGRGGGVEGAGEAGTAAVALQPAPAARALADDPTAGQAP